MGWLALILVGFIPVKHLFVPAYVRMNRLTKAMDLTVDDV